MDTAEQNSIPEILLVAFHSAQSPQAVPLANAFLKSAATGFPVDIKLIDCFPGKSVEKYAGEISETEPYAVGFSMYVWNRELIIKVAMHIRILHPAVRLFAGGPEVTADSDNIAKLKVFDFIVIGEGEIPFKTFCKRVAGQLDHKDATGAFLSGVGGASGRVAVSDLDEIPSPYLSGIIDTRCYSGILWQLSRGCAFSCDFCFDSSGQGGVRRFSLQRIESELRHFSSTGVSQVFVLDSTFNQDAKRAKTILRMIRKITPGIHFHFEVRSEFIDREMAELFARINCSLQIGLQSSNPLVLRAVGRSFSQKDFCSRIALLNESGAVFGFDLMYGLPGDTFSGFLSSLDFALSLYPNHLDIFPLAILPGTTLGIKSADVGLQHLSHPPYTLVSSPTFSKMEMEKSRQTASACDIFFTRGKAVAWFNAVIEVLGTKPSLFLIKFAEMMASRKGSGFSESDFSDKEIWNLQREFLVHTLSGGRLKRYQPLLFDLVDYHYHYAVAILSTQVVSSVHFTAKDKILDSKFTKSGSLQLATFHYNILEIIETGAPDIVWMFKNLRQSGSCAVVYPHKNIINTELLDVSYYNLLESMDGSTTPRESALKFGLSINDTLEFLRFAMKNGLLTI